jgi:anti-sigma factor RsiW
MKDRSQQIDRYLDGSLDANEIRELFTWLAESQQNAEVFARQSLLDQHLTELLNGGFMQPLETALEKSSKLETVQDNVRSWRRFRRLVWAGGLAAAFLIIFSLVMALIRTQKEVTDLKYELELARHDAAPVETDDSAIINFYTKEHQDLVARYASRNPTQQEPMQIQVSQDDILYYELLDGQPESMNPGIIVRGPSSQGQISPPKEPIISNGHTLSLSEAKETANFNLVAPLWLHPGYELDQITRIDGRDALQLLYTDGIKSVSLFEQPLDGQRGLEAKHFREYAVYRNIEQAAGTILAWRDHELSYVLIGNADMSQLMDMAQSISAGR